MSAKAKNKPKILLVDDETSNLELLHRTLYRDYEVFQASNGLQALETLATVSDIAVIVSDQRMPLMSGTELLSLTATQYPDIIRIILTAYTDVEDLVEAINSGKVFKYVTKPWKTDELRTLVSQAVDTHNVLKARTTELCRTLRQESLLNAVINTIRSRTSEAEILQTIVETVGQIFDVSYCILRPLHDGRLADEWYLYQNKKNQPIEVRGKKRGEDNSSPPLSSAAENPLSKTIASTNRLLAETIWETTDIQVINDVATDALFQEITPEVAQRRQTYAALDIRSSLVVPLTFRSDVLAILALHQCGQPRIWKDDEVQLGFMVADQASLSLSQVRAYEQVQALAKREALINTITSAIRSSLNPKDIFAAITQQLGEALQVDGCALSLWTENDEYVQCVGLYETGRSSVVGSESPDFPSLAPLSQEEVGGRLCGGAQGQRSMGAWEPSLPRSVVPISGNPVHQQLLATQQPVVIRDLQETPELSILDIPVGIDRTQEQSLSPSRALLVVPLLSDGKIIGSISLRHHHNPRRWLPAEIDLAQAVAAQAAIAVQQSRLYQTTRQQAERLLELDRLKTEFFQNISHEFRTPLTLTIGPLESAVQHQKSLSLEQAEIALRNCRRLLRLVNQLLNLQRLDAGRMQPTFRPCNFTEFVEQTVDTFRPYCEKKGLKLETIINPVSPLYLDLEKFDKVLYNLLSNAMKFTNAPGSITVTVEQSGNYCMLRVKDTGIGIRNDQIPHLFERFRQAEGSVSRSYEGSGLGLALAKELVELHGGQITVESVYEKGSSFTVWLPVGCSHLPLDKVIEVPTGVMPSRVDVELADLELETDAEIIDKTLLNLPLNVANSPNPVAVNAAGLGQTQAGIIKPHSLILMVDDNHDLRHYVASILKEQEYRTILARNGAEGFQLAQKYQPDLIVADLMMPLVSGLDLIRMIRESAQLKGIPIILLTAKVDEDTRVEGVEQGADAYLGKPFNDRELLALVHNLLALKENERRIKELNSYLTESVLKRFLPPGMVQKAARGELQLDLSPEPRLITILFSDIVGFTQMSNNLRSRRVAEILNEYLDAMTKAVFEHSGTVDKFVGDAIIAIFGAPEESNPNEQVANALAAAKKMQRSLIQLNEKWQAQGLPEVKFRCGIHQGTAVVGMFGNAERSDYTAIGPSVNIAARLQEASEPNRILVSAAVADYLNDDEIIKYQPLKLKGIDETVLTFLVK